ncbi:MAG: hypothetical protein WCI60_03260 [bacterium]
MSRIANVNEAMYGKEPSATNTSLAVLLDYYAQAHTKEEKKKWYIDYLNLTDPQYSAIIAILPDSNFASIGSLARIWVRGGTLIAVDNSLKAATIKFLAEAKKIQMESDADNIKKTRTKEILTLRLSQDLIGQIDEQIDICMQNNYSSKFDMASWVKGNKVSLDIQSKIQTRVQKMYDEVVLSDSDLDLAEGYSHLTKRKKRDFLAFLSSILSTRIDNASRKPGVPRKVKAKTPDKLVKYIKYMPDFPGLKLTSIDPKEIIGATSLWVYNSKYRLLTNYMSDAGLSIKGSTLINISSSVGKKVRKPEQVIPMISSMTKPALKKVMDNLTTTETVCNGRINKDIVLLRAVK